MYYVPYERVSHFLAIAKKFNIFHYDIDCSEPMCIKFSPAGATGSARCGASAASPVFPSLRKATVTLLLRVMPPARYQRPSAWPERGRC